MSGEGRFTLGSFRGRQVAVVGMGKSNQALTRYLIKEGAEVTCFDRKSAEELGPAYGEMSAIGARWSLGPGYLSSLPRYRWVFLTPGMKKSQPEITEARLSGAVVSSEIGLFLDRCKCQVAAVTGSAGKTTTCTLAGMMLRESMPPSSVYVGGNIGSVLIEKVDDIPEDAVVILELSSFQLELVDRSPHVAVILNIRPNHLDVHDSYEEYAAAKKRIYRFQSRRDWCFLNLDDGSTCEIAPACPGGTGFFSTLGKVPCRVDEARGGGPSETTSRCAPPFAWADEGGLYVDLGPAAPETGAVSSWAGAGPVRIAGRDDFLVPGEHNVSNALAAALLAGAMGAAPEGIGAAIRNFRGVEHRIEFVRELRGVKYYNDSIATSPDRTMALLEAVPGLLVLILGGYDKGLPFDELADMVAARGCSVVTMGKTATKIEEALRAARERASASAKTCARRAGSLTEAVQLAAEMAAGTGGSVALSPACASFDMFAGFEERGRLFKEAVRRLE